MGAKRSVENKTGADFSFGDMERQSARQPRLLAAGVGCGIYVWKVQGKEMLARRAGWWCPRRAASRGTDYNPLP